MRELRAYCPDVVIEIDLTEPERALIGLMPLQEGKFFWMNNGASGYGDYSAFRTKSMRNSVNATARLLPPEVLTYAVYPHNKSPYGAQRYNLNTALQAGHGFWGNLATTSSSDRRYVRSAVEKARRVLRHVAGRPLRVEGRIGSSPETYLQTAPERGYALFTAFSGAPAECTRHIALDVGQVLGATPSASAAATPPGCTWPCPTAHGRSMRTSRSRHCPTARCGCASTPRSRRRSSGGKPPIRLRPAVPCESAPKRPPAPNENPGMQDIPGQAIVLSAVSL